MFLLRDVRHLRTQRGASLPRRSVAEKYFKLLVESTKTFHSFSVDSLSEDSAAADSAVAVADVDSETDDTESLLAGALQQQHRTQRRHARRLRSWTGFQFVVAELSGGWFHLGSGRSSHRHGTQQFGRLQRQRPQPPLVGGQFEYERRAGSQR